MSRFSWLAVAGAAALTLALSVALIVKPPNQLSRSEPMVPWAGPVHRSFVALSDSVDLAYRQAQPQVPKAEDHVYGGIIPHHLMVQDKIAAFFAGLEGASYGTVVLIGPNHARAGHSPAITSLAQWQTPYGRIQPDARAIGALVEAGAVVDEAPFEAEHSIFNLTPFIRRSLPGVAIVPLIMDVSSTPALEQRLADALRLTVDDARTLVLASVDFSHYLPTLAADFHDQLAAGVLQAGQVERLPTLEVDSSASLSVLMRYLGGIGAQRAQQLFHTNSGALLGDPDVLGTSHLLYYFTPGQPSAALVANALFFGDVMLDRNVRSLVAQRGLGYVLDGLAGEERRFFRGLDVVSANLEGAVTDGGAHYPPQAGIDFAFSPSTVSELGSYGFNFFNIANNHTVDQGRRGWDETRQNLAEAGFAYAGCPDGEVGECSATTTQAGLLRLGWAGFSSVYRPFDLSQASALVRQLASTTDFVTVQVHWGQEYTHSFGEAQQRVAHALVEAGADLVIGHHPHVVQGLERYRGKLIFYSLGNFIFDQYFSTDTQRGLAVGVTLARQEGERASVERAYLFPLAASDGQLRLLVGEPRSAALRDLSSWSELSQDDVNATTAGVLP